MDQTPDFAVLLKRNSQMLMDRPSHVKDNAELIGGAAGRAAARATFLGGIAMKKAVTTILSLILVVGMSAWAAAQEPPAKQPPERKSVPAGLGFNIHVMGTDQDWDAIRAAGAKLVRADFAWGGIEKVKGEYDFRRATNSWTP